MAEYSGVWSSPICLQNPPHEVEKNKFIYVNRSKEHSLRRPSIVLINPHFKENKKVFLNPNFQMIKNETTSRPKVHVNPNILRAVTSYSGPVVTSANFFSGNPSITNFSSVKSRTPSSTAIEMESRVDPVQIIHKPTPIVRANFQTQRPNSFCKINSSIDNRKIVSAKNNILNLSQKTQTREQSILKPIVQPNSALYKINRLKSDQDCNTPLDLRNSGQNQRMVHTRLKIVNISNTKQDDIVSSMKKQKPNGPIKDRTICTRFKYIRKVEAAPSPNIKKIKSTAIVQKRNSLENSSVRKNSIITRYKYIRNGAKLMKVNKNPVKSKYKIVNNNSNKSLEGEKNKNNSSSYKKKYVYLNKYNSSSFLANNVILKNSKQRNLIKINGILYQNSPCLLKKATLSTSSGSKGINTIKQLVKGQGKYKIVRSQMASGTKLKKSNMACPIYKKTGKCNGQKTGTCIKVHNPNQIILCKRFLQGICRNNNCPLSHKVSSEKMPTCKYFLEGLCNKQECQYMHVKINPNADICRDFLEGFCKEGMKCDKRHQFLCPEYEKSQKCSKPKCEYPHGTSKLMRSKSEKNKLRKIVPKKTLKKTPVPKCLENCQVRYYKENSDETAQSQTNSERTNEEEVARPKRQKLGSLPTFIPIL